MSFLLRLNHLLSQVELRLWRSFEPVRPALAYNLIPVVAGSMPSMEPTSGSLLDGIMDSFLWAAVPKTRISKRRRLMRRNGCTYVREYMSPKKNIVACLECGHFHERHTICGNCYEKVKDETSAMKEAMGDNFLFDHPETEVEFVYEDEKPKSDKNFIVEIEKPRPEWFSKNLLSKSRDH